MINQLLRFTPILKQKIWGGEKLKTVLNKKSNDDKIGESWEVSDVDGDESIVSNGELKGKTLRDLISIYRDDLVGKHVYENFKNEFPLLIKYIDAKEVLSIQLHPNDDLSKKQHDSYGKTEMWYVMQSDEESNIIIGFKEDSNEEEYLHHLRNKSLLEILNSDQVNKGDAYFIPPGRVHAIGGGLLLAEIQQTSDVTYRIYDWDREDIDGNYRELHTDKALKAIDFKSKKTYKSDYFKESNKASEVVSCPYFTTNVLPITSNLSVKHHDKDSFVIYMCVEGKVDFIYGSQTETIQMGETLLVPACIKEFEIQPNIDSELLEIYIK